LCRSPAGCTAGKTFSGSRRELWAGKTITEAIERNEMKNRKGREKRK